MSEIEVNIWNKVNQTAAAVAHVKPKSYSLSMGPFNSFWLNDFQFSQFYGASQLFPSPLLSSLTRLRQK